MTGSPTKLMKSTNPLSNPVFAGFNTDFNTISAMGTRMGMEDFSALGGS